jgi:hypothetical protein
MNQENHSAPSLLTIISGGQTGADLAGLDVAIARGIPHAGWCPKGRKTELGRLPNCYQLTETKTTSYLERTERNVVDSDATVLFTRGPLASGSKRTADFARFHRRPLLHLILPGVPDELAVARIVAFVRAHRVARLNVAGSRESKAPGIHADVSRVLNMALDQLDPPTPEAPLDRS